MRTTKFPIYESRDNEGKCPKRRDSVNPGNIYFMLEENKKRLCQGSPEKTELTGRYNVRHVPERRALQGEEALL